MNSGRRKWLGCGWLCVALAVSGCKATHPPKGSGPGDAHDAGGDDGGGTDPGDLAHVDPCASYDCSNVVDAVVVRLLADNGLPLVPEDVGVLCRRMAIDLTGVPPTRAELDTQCAGHGARDIATYFMNKPTGPNVPTQILDPGGNPITDPNPPTPYVFVNRRAWADQLQYQATSIQGNQNSYYAFARALDRIVADTYAGKIKYDELARRALGNPAFVRRFGVFNTNTDLVQIASQAYRMFLGREALPSEAADLGNLWRPWVTKLMDEATSELKYPDCPTTVDSKGKRNGCYHTDLGLDGSLCAGTSLASCQSTVLGAAQVVPPSPGVVVWPDFGAGEQAVVETPGKLIAARPEFADAAVDRSLSRYLGWWKAGFFKPDFDLPAVRDALSHKFVADGYDVRKLDYEIVTSVLYTQAATLRAGESATDPIWAFGPTKIASAEVWLDGIGQALGKQLGGCDFVFSVGTQAPMPSMVFPLSAGIKDTFYATTATQLGGCPKAAPHTDPTGLVAAIQRRTALATLCPGAFAAAPTPDALVAKEFVGIGRDPSADEKQAALTRIASCAAGDTCTPQGLADALCTTLFASSLTTYY